MIGGSRLLATAACVVAVLSGCAPSGEARATSDADPPATSGPQSKGLLLHGRVTDDGEPIEDAEVWVSVWPADMGADVPAGENVDTLDTDPVTTAGDGTWRVTLDGTEVPSRYLLSGNAAGTGAVNTDLYVRRGDTYASWSLPLTLLEEAGVWRADERDNLADDAVRVDLDLAAETLTLTDSDGVAEDHELPVFDRGR